MIDLGRLPVDGGFLLGVALYAGASLLGGQLVAGRMVELAGWRPACEARIQASIVARTPAAERPRPTDCAAKLGWLHPDIARLCHQFGNPDLEGPAEQARKLRRAAEARRLEWEAAGAGSRCECAGLVYAREAMIPFAIYAGSARLISLPEVEAMEGGLRAALDAPACLPFAGEGRP